MMACLKLIVGDIGFMGHDVIAHTATTGAVTIKELMKFAIYCENPCIVK